MSWRTNATMVRVRNIGRSLGINRLITRIYDGHGYEAAYDNLFTGRLRPGDCVWDVGANVGYYTKLFSTLVTDMGRVVAFEPSPVNFAALRGNCAEIKHVELHNLGLGDENENLFLEQGEDPLGATSRLVSSANPVNAVSVPVRLGDDLIRERAVPAPNAIKIDVEGFELEVLTGLKNYLKKEDLRVIGVEVHFKLLNDRGLADGPKKIEDLLRKSNFKWTWPDSSHIVATR